MILTKMGYQKKKRHIFDYLILNSPYLKSIIVEFVIFVKIKLFMTIFENSEVKIIEFFVYLI